MTKFYKIPGRTNSYDAPTAVLAYCAFHRCENCALNDLAIPCHQLTTFQSIRILLDKKLIEEVEEND